MTTNTDNKRPAQWLALYFPDLAEGDRLATDECLERLAGWCYQYSSRVCIAPQRNSLLLEVAVSRSLFGDAKTLAERIRTELKGLGYRPGCGIAPTLEAAHLAARHGLHIHTSKDIRESIGALDITSLALPTTQIQALQKAGFRTIAEIFRLVGW